MQTAPIAGAAAPFTEADLQQKSETNKPVDEKITNGYTTPGKPPETVIEPAAEPKAKAKAKATKSANSKPKAKAAKSAEKKTPKPKAASKAKRILVFGKPATAVIRRLGKNGYKFPEIAAGLKALGVEVANATVRVFLSAGRHGQRGEPAHLSREELSEFKAKAKEVLEAKTAEVVAK